MLSVLTKEPREDEGRVTRVLELELVWLARVRLREMRGREERSGSMKTSRHVSALSLVSRLILTAGISLASPCSVIPPCNCFPFFTE